MKNSFCLFLFSSILLTSCKPHWDKATEWTLYGAQGSQIFSVPVDSLGSYDTIRLNTDSVTSYLSAAKTLASNPPVWMGGYLATCKINGTIRKVEFSNYGGFFYDERSRTYFQLPSSKIDGWLGYLYNSLMTLARRKLALNRGERTYLFPNARFQGAYTLPR